MYINQMGFHFKFGVKHWNKSILYRHMYMNLGSSLQKYISRNDPASKAFALQAWERQPSGQKVNEQVVLPPPRGGLWQHKVWSAPTKVLSFHTQFSQIQHSHMIFVLVFC